MKVYGLTGGIATGKSTVSAIFRELGAQIVDADEAARAVVAPGTQAFRELAAAFPEAISAEGVLNRSALAARIFADPRARRCLEAITHPRIAAHVKAALAELDRLGFSLALYDAALLIENRVHERLDGLILVTAPSKVQRERLMHRDGLTEREASARIDAQSRPEDNRKYASWIIDNGGAISATRTQCEEVWSSLNSGR